ncbi:Dfp1/Him1, central region-domain-containing protein [Crassisporium funariophilum]|nr:Dfp1/Him1, central region-domain-containing protein [Crassisporium funariophilum]
MATFQPHRRPLAHRLFPGQGTALPTPTKQNRIVSGSKRPRSPDQSDARAPLKRAKATPPSVVPTPRDLEKERRHIEREQKDQEFRAKFKAVFPTFRFFLDIENMDEGIVYTLKSRIERLGGRIEPFLSAAITHLVSDRPLPVKLNPDKENEQVLRSTSSKATRDLRSPIKLTPRPEEPLVSKDAVSFALGLNKKVWTTAKLESVLSRCLDTTSTKSAMTPRPPAPKPPAPRRDLARLLQSEKIHGTTERDPTQKRHDFYYFARGSCFVLLEDMRQELATISAHEYPIFKERDKLVKAPWPVLHCHPNSRNPFAPFDDKERKRWERTQQQAEKAEDADRARRKKRQLQLAAALRRKAEAQKHGNKVCDLRRSVSLNNLQRRLSFPTGEGLDADFVDLDDDSVDSANASGFLASGAGQGYMAASGNSVGITSNTGTTSNHSLRNVQLPARMAGRIKQEIKTTLKFPPKTQDTGKAGAMGPPSKVPTKVALLKKSKSTNNIKLSKREEGAKPGYCESCRLKFEDFNTHLESNKHRKFAANDANFEALDEVLCRLRRRTRREVQEYEQAPRLHNHCIAPRSNHLRMSVARYVQQLSPP